MKIHFRLRNLVFQPLNKIICTASILESLERGIQLFKTLTFHGTMNT